MRSKLVESPRGGIGHQRVDQNGWGYNSVNSGGRPILYASVILEGAYARINNVRMSGG